MRDIAQNCIVRSNEQSKTSGCDTSDQTGLLTFSSAQPRSDKQHCRLTICSIFEGMINLVLFFFFEKPPLAFSRSLKVMVTSVNMLSQGGVLSPYLNLLVQN